MDSDTLCAQLINEHLLGEQREKGEQIRRTNSKLPT